MLKFSRDAGDDVLTRDNLKEVWGYQKLSFDSKRGTNHIRGCAK